MNQVLNLCTKLRNFNSGIIRNYSKNITGKKKVPLYPLGQITNQTHPHLLKDGEVLPSISKNEFQERQQKLIESITKHTKVLQQSAKRQLIVIPSATKLYMSDKIPYVFHQNTEFLYLSGCLEPDCCLILTNAHSGSSEPSTILFVREKDHHHELWDGPRTRPVDAKSWFGVDESLHMSELQNYLRCFMKDNESFMLWYDYINCPQPKLNDIMREFARETGLKAVESPDAHVQNLRLIKSPAEMKLMAKTCEIASEAIADTMAASKPGISEHEIFATVDYECRKRGANYLAYPPVVAGGSRANTIHYIDNNQLVKDNELVLMDAGCYYHGFCSDITRTWPVNGKFSDAQKTLYEALLDVQCKLIDICCDVSHLDALFEQMCKLLGKNLQEIGLIGANDTKETVMKKAYEFCPHHVSHYLGMDVHDTPSIRRNLKMRPGMVITVEPGIYVNKDDRIPPEFHGLGLRIEDDVLITESGPVVLTKKCPKTIEDIERIAASK